MTEQFEEMMRKKDIEDKCTHCPECVVLFDDTGYHGCKPDSNSPICKICIKDAPTDCDQGRICPKCGKVMILCEDEKTCYQFWECDGCRYKEDD